MKSRAAISFLLLCVLVFHAYALETERVSDQEFHQVLESLEKTVIRFRNGLDPSIRQAMIGSSRSAQTDVEHFFEDFTTNIERLGERYAADYSAEAEARAVLRQGDDLKAFVAAHPRMKGSEEWQLLDADLARLANAYTAGWPLDAANPQVRRIDDQQFFAALEAIDRGIGALDRATDEQFRTMAPSQQAIATGLMREAKLANGLVKPLRSTLQAGEPALAEARILLEKAASLDTMAAQLPLDEKVRERWRTTRNAVGRFAQGFGLAWPPVQ